MRLFATRLQEGQDLRKGIVDFAIKKGITAGSVISAVGSLTNAKVRMAGDSNEGMEVREYSGLFEIVSLIGTVSGTNEGDCHLHLSISDKEGKVIGGHLKDGCKVQTTVELVIISDEKLQFTREKDDKTGYSELIVKEV